MRVGPCLVDRQCQRILARATLGALALAAVVIVVGHPLGAFDGGFMCMLPMLGLAAILFAGRYPGEDVIGRLVLARRAGRPSRARSIRLPRQRPRHDLCGGRLIAVSLASRGPPLAASWR
jgi:hypothetical protein